MQQGAGWAAKALQAGRLCVVQLRGQVPVQPDVGLQVICLRSQGSTLGYRTAPLLRLGGQERIVRFAFELHRPHESIRRTCQADFRM